MPNDFYMPPEEEVHRRYQETKQKPYDLGRNRNLFVKFLGPQGQTRWNNAVPIGYEASLVLRILPPPNPSPANPTPHIFLEQKTHFWKSAAHPQGSQIGCAGKDRCAVCRAREAGLAHPDPQVQKRAKEFGRVKTNFLYQVAMVQYPQAHFGEDGVMRPLILSAGSKLHSSLGELVHGRGFAKIVHPTAGRDLSVKKKKVGSNDMDVEYGVLDLDPAPIPPTFYPLLSNLLDLHEFIREASEQEQLAAVAEMQLPMPGQAQSTAAYNPMPQAPYGNPYQAAASAPAFQGYPPAPVSPPAYQSQYLPPAYNLPPSPAPAVFQGFEGPPSPPVSSQPAAMSYKPLPGAPGGAIPEQVVPAVPPVDANTPRRLVGPVRDPLPGGREACFGKFSPADRYCVECPEWIKSQCVPVSGLAPQASAPGSETKLDQLQAQLMGQNPQR